MSPTAGRSLLQYRLIEPLGQGGMGVVWRATDSALGRDAAIKLLPEGFAGDPERLARFEREAKLLASLSHPNIAAVYGLHLADGVRFLAMEMVRGEDLSARLARGPLPLDESLAIARQIAEAVETAHENGVIHRDLKPANVRVGPDGTVKVLDFGLAKAFDTAPASGAELSAASPTVTSAGSVLGLILGTAAYMSPEQARGRPVDRRADIWAFGCVLYEMLTAARPFEGETVSDSIAKILQTEPDLSALPPGTPAGVRQLIARCLVKDPRRRLRDMGDARLALEEAAAGSEPRTSAATSRREWFPWAVAGVALAAALASAAFWLGRGGAVGPARETRVLALEAPAGTRFTDQPGDVAVAPDGGSLVAVVLGEDGTSRLCLRRLDDPAWRPLPGTEGAYFPFWSPDGRFVGFFAASKLKKLAVGGGLPDTICEAASGRGGTWNQDGVIVFAPGNFGPLLQVRAAGGEPTPATELDASEGELGHRFPRFLSDGRRFLYASIPVREGGHESWLGTLASKERTRVLVSDGVPAIAGPHRLVYRRNKTLFVQRFDADAGGLSGEPRALVEAGLASGFLAAPTSSAAGTEVLAFIPPFDFSTELVWFTLEGVQGETLPLPKGGYVEIRFSPDGTRVATSRFEKDNPQAVGSDVWLVDLERRSGSRVTFDPQFEFGPVWSPDGKGILYHSNREGAYRIYRISAEGAGEELALSEPRGLSQQPADVTPDGKGVVFQTAEARTGFDLWILDLTGARPPAPYLTTSANEQEARLSPDGRWISYLSDETGRNELYVQSFPVPGSKIQVSNGGARTGVWRRDGRRLFYIAPDQSLMAADVTPGPSLRAGAPVRLFRFPRDTASYDVAPGGTRVLASMAASDALGRTIGVMLDWDGAR